MFVQKNLLVTILVWVMFFLSKNIFSQKTQLNITALSEHEKKVLAQINYQKNHIKEKEIYETCSLISEILKKEGYFTNTIDSIVKKDSIYTSYFSLRKKLKKIALIHENKIKLTDTVFLSPKEIENHLTKITLDLDSKGASFSKITLNKNQLKNDTLFTYLKISSSKKRTIDKVISKGYTGFPKKFIKNHLLITENKTTFSKRKLKKISNSINSLPFIEVIKPPETLFKKDSTLLYLYLDKKHNNSFDGLINFTTKEDGGILFNGILDIQLNNIFNKGEFFALRWNAIGDERQEFDIKLETPYVFNSKITPELSFSIYRQDSTFINTKFSGLLDYSINNRSSLGISLLNESSESTTQINQNNNTSYDSFFVGINFRYRILSKNELLGDKFFLNVNPLTGNRNSVEMTERQFKLNTIVSYLLGINPKNYFYLKNTTGILSSGSFLNNELFRIGGANSIRGFNEQRFFTSNYTYFTIEYRYLSSPTSYFYTITDLGRLKVSSDFNNVIGLGLGYSFTNKNSKINLSTAFGNNLNNQFQLRNAKFIANWKILF